MDVSVVVPLPISVADNTAAAFLPLVAEPPLVRVVRTLLGAVAEPGRIVVAAAEPLVDEVRAALASVELTSVTVAAVDGEASRADCLAAALEYLRQASFSTTHVLVHDISSPLISADVAQRVVAGMRGGGTVVMPELPVTDSVKAVDVRRFGHRHGRSIRRCVLSNFRAVSPSTRWPGCWHIARPTISTRSPWPLASPRRSPSSTVTPMRSAPNCPETQSSSRRSSRAGAGLNRA